jgi:4-hydroxyphenylpyruvate dioxygenase-like putative hemolysin
LRQKVQHLKDLYDDLGEHIEGIGLQVDGAHEAMEMALTEFMKDVGGKLDAMEKKISKVYAKVFQK